LQSKKGIMKNKFLKLCGLTLCTTMITVAILSSCNKKDNKNSDSQEESIETLLTRFDSLDFHVYSNQQWNDFSKSHADNILVHYPDGHTTTGLHDHVEELKPMFVFAPDTKITEHPIRFGTDGWTAVIGTMEGTFSQPMHTADGGTIPPTGKKFRMQMSTIAHWENGKMIEEYLFWDNQEFLKQIGIE
jgi:predicted ester cyclase